MKPIVCEPTRTTHPENRPSSAFRMSDRACRATDPAIARLATASWAVVMSLLLLLLTALFVSAKENSMSDSIAIERRLSNTFVQYKLEIKSISDRPDQPAGEIHYIVKDLFTTINGSFDPSSEAGSIPQWAHDAYASENFLEAGSNHHLFAAVIGLDGTLVKSYPVRFWSDGFDKLSDPNYTGYINEVTKESSGWANNPLWSSSSFDPAQGMTGPWCWAPDGASDVICGGGLPNGADLSTFVVWQAVQGDVVIGTPTDPAPPTSPTDPPTPTPEVTPTPKITSTLPITRRVGTWVDSLRLEIKPLMGRPDTERRDFDQEETVYLLKDLFTTHNGSWEPNDEMGSIDLWARDAYLKELGAPDYFDDAGADHHLFAAIIGLDGQLLRNTEIIFWSDGYLKLADKEYTDYSSAFTKERSGWANIVLAESSSYAPDRLEQGPWCWMPKGAADVVCGGGLPLKNHISTFAVWQAVPRSALPPERTNFNLFLPFVTAED